VEGESFFQFLDLLQDNIDIDGLAKKLLGESIWVNWPHMFEAKVTALETEEWRVELTGKNKETKKRKMDSTDEAIFMSNIESVTDRYVQIHP